MCIVQPMHGETTQQRQRMGRYYKITYEGIQLMEVFATSAREAKQKAIYTYQKEGRRGMNLARLCAE